MNKFNLKTLATLAIVLCTLGFSWQVSAGEIRVAVASNFADAIKVIAHKFEAESGHTVKLVFGSTGKHYAQIRNGAPFDIFFAADVRRPEQLERDGEIETDSRFTYAIGKLILWSPRANYVDPAGDVVESGGFRYLAIANPRLAPYGKAAQEVLQDRGVWEAFKRKMVRGENIGQTFQFVSSGNAELGFVAYSQIKRPGQSIEGSFWEVPSELYSPINQQAVLLVDKDPAREFVSYMKSDEILEIIRGFGYGTP